MNEYNDEIFDELGSPYSEDMATSAADFDQENFESDTDEDEGAPVSAKVAGVRANRMRQKMAKRKMGGFNRSTKLPFLRLVGGKFEDAPLDLKSTYHAASKEQLMEKAFLETPFQTVTADDSAATFQMSFGSADLITGSAKVFLPPMIRLQFGQSKLDAVESAIITVDMNWLGIDGSYRDVQNIIIKQTTSTSVLTISPWATIANTNHLLGTQVTDATRATGDATKPAWWDFDATTGATTVKDFAVRVSGLPAGGICSVIIPGANHPSVKRFLNKVR